MTIEGYIYCVTCLVNGKMYIGQTVKSIEKRFKEHKQASRRGVPFRLYSAIRKYGEENFTIEEVIQITAPNRRILKAKLCFIEERLIRRLQTKKYGYNSTDGGEGVVGSVWTEERREKARQAAKVRLSKYWGMKHTDETKRKISQSNMGRECAMKGKHHSEEVKRKISKANLGHVGALRGKTLSEEHRKKISKTKTGVKRGNFSKEWKDKLSEAHRGKRNHFFGKKHSEEARRKMSEAKRRKNYEILVQ